jgi:hypothetical protein
LNTPGILWLLALCLLASAVGATEQRYDEPLFHSDEVIALTLQAPWGAIERKTSGRRHPAVLAYTDAAGQPVRIAATIEVRGITRLRHCEFPPLRLRFEPAAVAGTVFAGQRSLKMVTHCKKGGIYRQYTVLELLSYRIYQQITPLSFRVRPLEVQYAEPGKAGAGDARLAFLIEDEKDAARRNGHKRDKGTRFTPGDFDSLGMSRLMLFQYLIGNTDFAVLSGPSDEECCHNVRVIGTGDPQGRIALPYDFDSTGLVDAVYAAPHEALPIRKVSERLYRGFCAHNDTLAAARAEFLARREAIFALIAAEPRLDAQRRHKAVRYVEAFYATLGSDWRVQQDIIGQCRR